MTTGTPASLAASRPQIAGFVSKVWTTAGRSAPKYSDELPDRPQVAERVHATRHLVAAVSLALRCERRREPWLGPHCTQIELAFEPFHQRLASVDIRPADETDHRLRTAPGGPDRSRPG